MDYKFINCTDIEQLIMGKVEYCAATGSDQNLEDFLKSTLKMDKVFCKYTTGATKDDDPNAISIAFNTTETDDVTFIWWSGEPSLETYKNEIVSYIEDPVEIPTSDLIERTAEIQSCEQEQLTFVTDTKTNVSYIL